MNTDSVCNNELFRFSIHANKIQGFCLNVVHQLQVSMINSEFYLY